MVKFDLSFWTKASTRRKRIYSFIVIFVVAVLLTVIGSLVPLSPQYARQTSNQLNQTLNQNRASGTLPEYIFSNNFSICLVMFIPIIGPILGFFILFNTGLALAAISQVQGLPPLLEVALLILTPVFWLEFTSYSIGITESIWLFRRILQHRLGELKNTAILIGVCAGLLAAGAIVETWLISIGA
jgi:hypothetical protein